MMRAEEGHPGLQARPLSIHTTAYRNTLLGTTEKQRQGNSLNQSKCHVPTRKSRNKVSDIHVPTIFNR